MQNRKNTNSRKVGNTALVVRIPSRRIPEHTRLMLYVRAGGRCEFDGCNQYLLEHHLTLAEGNYAQMAHIVAFREYGPRGKANNRPKSINKVDNLMLLCSGCHHLIDENSKQYTVATLREYKKHHEERIRHVTSLGPDLKTTVVQLKAIIGSQTVAIPIAQVSEAVAPRYPTDTHGLVIDLTKIYGDDESFIKTATRTIDRELEHLYAPGMDLEYTRHISLFALAPIPLLVYLEGWTSPDLLRDKLRKLSKTA